MTANHAARRPPSLKEQALKELKDWTDEKHGPGGEVHLCEGLSVALIRRALEAPTLLERALAGDATAARQFLHQAGFTDKQGQWLPQYQPVVEDDVDLYLKQ